MSIPCYYTAILLIRLVGNPVVAFKLYFIRAFCNYSAFIGCPFYCLSLQLHALALKYEMGTMYNLSMLHGQAHAALMKITHTHTFFFL